MKITCILFLLGLSLTSNAQVTAQNEIVPEVMAILKATESEGYSGFKNRLINYDDFQAIGADASISEEVRSKFKSATKESIEKLFKDYYDEIVEEGMKYSTQVKWNKIKYDDATIEPFDVGGLNGYEGRGYFRHKGMRRSIKYSAIWRDDHYVMFYVTPRL